MIKWLGADVPSKIGHGFKQQTLLTTGLVIIQKLEHLHFIQQDSALLPHDLSTRYGHNAGLITTNLNFYGKADPSRP